jgi:hypothetical protein
MSSPIPGRVLATLATLLAVAAAAGCSETTHGAHDPQMTSSPVSGQPTVQGRRIDVTIATDQVHPAGKRIVVRAGAPVTLVIQSATRGELHVHSSPERQVVYPRGRSSATLRIDQPGIVDVESHQLDKLVVRLEVR